MTRFLTRDESTTLEFDTSDGVLWLVGPPLDESAITITPAAAVNLASALLQYSTQAKAAELANAN